MFKITLYITPFVLILIFFGFIFYKILTKNGKGDDFWGNSKKDNHVSSAYRDVKTQKKTKKPKRSSLNIEEHEG
jgi:hypothetical protein